MTPSTCVTTHPISRPGTDPGSDSFAIANRDKCRHHFGVSTYLDASFQKDAGLSMR